MNSPPVVKKGKIKRVVFADNDRLLREAVGDFLGTAGFEVYLAEDGLSAWELTRAQRPDCVILDVIMPELTGARVCGMIRQDPALRDTKIIAFSALGTQDFRWFPELSADAYVAKGVLLDACRNLLLAIDHLGAYTEQSSSAIFGYEADARGVVGEILDERQHLLDILDSLGSALLELNEKGQIVLATSAACKILGRSESSLIGERVVSLCEPESAAILQQRTKDLTEEHGPPRSRVEIGMCGQQLMMELVPIHRKRERMLAILELSS